jgi:DNA-binding MarR family transcriptional regulator
MKNKLARQAAATASLDQLYTRPGFMIRRAHQISIDIFIEACRPLELTPSQYGVMFVLNHAGPLSQIGIARLLGLDRSTTALVVKILIERGFVGKTKSEEDARKTEIVLTPEGNRVMRSADKRATKSKDALMAPFTAAESKQLLALLSKFVNHFNEKTRVAIRPAS